MKKKFFLQGYLVLMLLLFFVPEVHAAQNIKIEIPSVIYTTEDTLKLGTIARISGGNIRTRRILSELQVFTDGRRLMRSEVLRAISESDASDARIELHMPEYSRLEAPAYEGNFTGSSEQDISDLVPLLKSLSAWDGRLEVSASSSVPEGRLIDPASIVPGTQAVTLRFQGSDGRIRSLAVRLSWFQNVMIASRNITKGSRVLPGDMMSREMKITRPGVYASSPEEISGFTANRNIKQGEAILLSNLTSSGIIKKGRNIKIVARFGAASAAVDGILLEDGRPGDWVRVRRADDKRVILRARIINENLVEVNVE